MKLIFLFIGVLISGSNFCQSTNLDAPGQLPVFKMVSHPFLPIITSEYFYFSQDGLMWFSTAQGLNSFDGSEIINYSTPEQAYILGLNTIGAIAEDNANNLYICGDSKLTYFNRKDKTFSILNYRFKETSTQSAINATNIYIDTNGQVYIGTDAEGLLIYNPNLKTFEHFNLDTARTNCWDAENLNTVSSFAPHATDPTKLWVGSFNGIYLFDKITRKFIRNFNVVNPGINKYRRCPPLYDIRKMDVLNDSTIWFNTASYGFGKYNTRTGLVKLFMHGGRIQTDEVWKAYNIREFAKLDKNEYIVGITDPHPGIFNTKTEKLDLFNMSQRPNVYDDIQYVTNDRKGNVWIMSKGLLYVSIPDYYRLRTVSIKEQVSRDYLSNRLGDIYFDGASSRYYAAVAFSNGVYVLDSNMNVVKNIPVPLFTNRWTYKETCTEFITKDGSGRFWTTGMETYIWQPGQDRFDYIDKKLPSLKWLKDQGEAWDITTTRQGNILLRFDNNLFHINHATLAVDSVGLSGSEWSSPNVIGTTDIIYDSIRNKVYINNPKTIAQYDIATRKKTPLSYNLLFGSTDRSSQLIDYAIDVQGRLFNSQNRVQAMEYALDDKGRIWVWIPRFGVRIIDPDKLVCIDSIPNGTRGFMNGNYIHIRSGGKNCMLFIGLGGLVAYNFDKKKSLLFDANNGWSGEFDYYKGYCNNHLVIGGRNQLEYFNLADFSKFNLKLKPRLNTVTAAGADVVFTRNSSDDNRDIQLSHDQNSLTFSFSAPEFFFPERIEYAYQLSNADKDWQYSNSFNRKITYSQLSPGRYVFKLKAQLAGDNWEATPMEYVIIIKPAFWQTWWFKLLSVCLLVLTILLFYRNRINSIHQKALQKSKHEKELLYLEAKALRAQMNPHFIFNCMNSIKSLIQQGENDKAVEYLTTFSKLIRTIFQNSDRREITLFDELETCRLYTQLEGMRFDNKFSCFFEVDESLDLKSIMIPALVIQPFIENAIWHGIMPKKEGGAVKVAISKENNTIRCMISDDGIGREMSLQNKFKTDFPNHQSRGVNLTHTRLDLDNLLNERKANLEIIDQKNAEGKATGTTVILTFDEY